MMKKFDISQLFVFTVMISIVLGFNYWFLGLEGKHFRIFWQEFVIVWKVISTSYSVEDIKSLREIPIAGALVPAISGCFVGVVSFIAFVFFLGVFLFKCWKYVFTPRKSRYVSQINR